MSAVRMASLLAEAVALRGLSQRQFATLVGASPKHVCRVFNGQETAHTKTLDKWAEALRVRFVIELEDA